MIVTATTNIPRYLLYLKSLQLNIYNEAKKNNKHEKRRPFWRSGQLSTDSERERWNIPLLRSNLDQTLTNFCTVHFGTVEQRFLLAGHADPGREGKSTWQWKVGKGKDANLFLLCTSLHTVAPTLHYAVISWKYPSYVFKVLTLLVKIHNHKLLKHILCATL